jgi:hypothetical protein
VDLDGAEKVYEVINASCAELTSDYFSVFPNPSSGEFQVIIKNNPAVGTAQLKLINAMGSETMHKTIQIGAGMNTYMISQHFATGIYYMIFIDKYLNRKVIKLVIR